MNPNHDMIMRQVHRLHRNWGRPRSIYSVSLNFEGGRIQNPILKATFFVYLLLFIQLPILELSCNFHYFGLSRHAEISQKIEQWIPSIL